jgi:hypothetical protein
MRKRLLAIQRTAERPEDGLIQQAYFVMDVSGSYSLTRTLQAYIQTVQPALHRQQWRRPADSGHAVRRDERIAREVRMMAANPTTNYKLCPTSRAFTAFSGVGISLLRSS